jgi:hypothetical protein
VFVSRIHFVVDALTLELVVGERSGRRIVDRWAFVLLPLEGHVRLVQVSGGEAKMQEAHGHDLLLLAQAKLGEGGDADNLEAYVDVSHRVHAGAGNVAHHVSE